MSLPQGEVLVEGVRDWFQGAGLVGEGVPWRGGWGRGVLEEVDAVEFPSSSPTFSFTWRGKRGARGSARGRGEQFHSTHSKSNKTLNPIMLLTYDFEYTQRVSLRLKMCFCGEQLVVNVFG